MLKPLSVLSEVPSAELPPVVVVPVADRVAPRVRSEDLLRGAQELLIDHDGACYRLRLTAHGRLILTK
jgi:hemin uptake protein HemP